MSYILDALRKADAERERGSVPGLNAQPMFAGAPQAGRPARARPWIAILIGAVVLLSVGLLWMMFTPREAMRPVVATSAAMPVAAPAQAPAPIVVATAPVAIPAPAPTAAAVTHKPRPAASASVPSGAAASSAESRVYALNELPEEIRRQLPTLTVGGSMYSAKPADRLLILNGQVLHEGDRVAPDLVLQQIRLKAAVLAYKGYRYSITF